MATFCFHSVVQPLEDTDIAQWRSVWDNDLDGFLYAIYHEFKEAYSPCTVPGPSSHPIPRLPAGKDRIQIVQRPETHGIAGLRRIDQDHARTQAPSRVSRRS
jgi:hypothetical protein